jgi:hypothetical protein
MDPLMRSLKNKGFDVEWHIIFIGQVVNDPDGPFGNLTGIHLKNHIDKNVKNQYLKGTLNFAKDISELIMFGSWINAEECSKYAALAESTGGSFLAIDPSEESRKDINEIMTNVGTVVEEYRREKSSVLQLGPGDGSDSDSSGSSGASRLGAGQDKFQIEANEEEKFTENLQNDSQSYQNFFQKLRHSVKEEGTAEGEKTRKKQMDAYKKEEIAGRAEKFDWLRLTK